MLYYYDKYHAIVTHTHYERPITDDSPGTTTFRDFGYEIHGYNWNETYWQAGSNGGIGFGIYGWATYKTRTVTEEDQSPKLLYTVTGKTRTQRILGYLGGVDDVVLNVIIETATTEYTYGPGDFIERIEAEEGTYPTNGKDGSYWYIIDGAVPTEPAVSTIAPATGITYDIATIKGEITDTGGENPMRYLQWGETVTDNTEDMGIGGVGEFEFDLTGLDPNTLYYFRAYATNIAGTVYGDTESFTTLEKPLKAPTLNSPANNYETTDRTPTFDFTLVEETENDAVLYSARIRLSKTVGMENIEFTLESKDGTGTWEKFDDPGWSAMSTSGVTPGTRVRVTLTINLGYRQDYYWDVASYDHGAYGYGFNSPEPRRVRALITVDGLYILEINSIGYTVYNLRVTETSNGKIGAIEFDIDDDSGGAYTAINYDDDVVLAVNDINGNIEEFGGRVRKMMPQATGLSIVATLGGGVLGERLIDEDYASQDIGLTAKAIIDDYCTGLTSAGVDTSLDVSGPVPAIMKTPLKILEDLRRRYKFFYYVDKDWDFQLYLESAVTEATYLIQYGDGTSLYYNLLYELGAFDGTKYINGRSADINLNAIEANCVTSNGTDNYMDIGIVPIDSANWYWEFYGKFNALVDNDFMGSLGDANARFLVLANDTETKFKIGYKDDDGSGAPLITADTDWHKFTIYGNGIMYVDGVLAHDLSDATGAMTTYSIGLFALNRRDAFDSFVNFTMLYSKIVSNGTILQYLVFSMGSGDKVYDVVTGNAFTIEGTTSKATTWGNTQDVYHYNLENGFNYNYNSVANGDFSDDTTGWTPTNATAAITDNIYSLTGTGSVSYFHTLRSTGIEMEIGDKVFINVSVKVTNAVATIVGLILNDGGSFVGWFEQIDNPTENLEYQINGIFTATSHISDLTLRFYNEYADAGTQSGKVMQIDGTYGVQVVDLTTLDLILPHLDVLNKTGEQLKTLLPFLYNDDGTLKYLPKLIGADTDVLGNDLQYVQSDGKKILPFEGNFKYDEVASIIAADVNDWAFTAGSANTLAYSDLIANVEANDSIFFRVDTNWKDRNLWYSLTQAGAKLIKIKEYVGIE